MSAYFDWWDGRERRALLLDGDRLIVGSAPESDVVVGDASVSRIHAMLHQLNGRWFIEDCGSRNGTAVNGQQLTSLQPLRPNDEVRLGRARLVFCGQPSAGGNPTDAVIERPPSPLVSTMCWSRCVDRWPTAMSSPSRQRCGRWRPR